MEKKMKKIIKILSLTSFLINSENPQVAACKEKKINDDCSVKYEYKENIFTGKCISYDGQPLECVLDGSIQICKNKNIDDICEYIAPYKDIEKISGKCKMIKNNQSHSYNQLYCKDEKYLKWLTVKQLQKCDS